MIQTTIQLHDDRRKDYPLHHDLCPHDSSNMEEACCYVEGFGESAKKIGFYSNREIPAKRIAALFEKCVRCEELDLSFNHWVDDDFLKALTPARSNLLTDASLQPAPFLTKL